MTLRLLAAAAVLVAGQADVPELPPGQPSTRALAASVRVYNPGRSVTVYAPARSVTVLRTEVKAGAQTVVTISSDVLFDFDRATLTDAAGAAVAQTADRIAGTTAPVTVVGHTDSIGGDAYNLDLSKRRADAVAAALGSRLGPGVTIRTEGRGAREPVEPNTLGGNDNPEGRARNRRVTISFTARE